MSLLSAKGVNPPAIASPWSTLTRLSSREPARVVYPAKDIDIGTVHIPYRYPQHRVRDILLNAFLNFGLQFGKGLILSLYRPYQWE